MKSERRHELQQNTADQSLTGAPQLARRYGGMVLLIFVAALVGYLLIRYRISSADEARRLATENLAAARSNINQLSRLHLYPMPIPPQTIAEFRKSWANDARTAIDSITGSVSDPMLLAEATLAKGDLNWALAQMDELPGAATQPALRLESDKQTLLGEAKSAYEQVSTQHGDQQPTVIAAQFGLAAIHENNGAWDEAKQRYQQIADDAAVPESYRTQAKFRLERAADWSQPVLLAAATQRAAAAPSGVPFLDALSATPSTAAASATETSPATTSISATPSTQPATQPAAATGPVER